MKKATKKKIATALSIAVPTVVITAFGVTAYILGRRDGKADFVQQLIDHYEKGPTDAFDWPVFETRNHKMPDFIYMIKADCLGD